MRRRLAILVAAALSGAAVGLAAPPPAGAVPGQLVTLIGDSVMAGLNYSPAAQATISSSYPMLLDARVCRRLVAASCAYQGATPATALQVVQANAANLGDIVVINVGYNDSWTRYRADIDTVMAAVNAANVPHVVWVNLRQVGANAGGYANINAAMQNAAAAHPKIRVADWNGYSAGKPWFAADGLHLTTAGALEYAKFVKAHLDAVPPNRCSPSTSIGTPAPPLGSLPPSPPAKGARITPVNPVRLVDTRAGGRLGANKVLTVPVAGQAGVPGDAIGAIVNVTVVDACAPGYLTVYPAGLAAVPNASNANFRTGQVVAGLAFVKLGAGGALSVLASAQTDVLVDLMGYLHPTQGSLYNAVDPVRIYDSRPGYLGAGQEHAVAVRGAAGGAIPNQASVSGAIVNLTVTEPAGAGFLTLYPGPCNPANRPNASSINYVPGLTIANLIAATVGADGTVCVYSSAPAKFIVDVAGWLGPTGTGFKGVTPQRLVDTRGGAAVHPIVGRTGAGPLVVPMGTSSGVPANASGAVVNVTVVSPAGGGFLTAYPCSSPLPNASNVNFGPGDVRPNLVSVRIGAADNVCIQSTAPTDILVDLAGWFD